MQNVLQSDTSWYDEAIKHHSSCLNTGETNLKLIKLETSILSNYSIFNCVSKSEVCFLEKEDRTKVTFVKRYYKVMTSELSHQSCLTFCHVSTET